MPNFDYATDEKLIERAEIISSSEHWQDIFLSMVNDNPAMKD